MIDPLSALGVVGNILQIIDFGFRLIREGNELHNSSSGALEYNEDAEDRANQLTELTTKLTDSQDVWLAAHGQVNLDPNELRLRYLCERCGEIAVELKVQLRKLKVQGGPNKRRFRSYKQALLSVWRRDQIDAIDARLEKYQREIDTHILIGLRQSTEIGQLENTERFNALDQQTQDLMRTVLGGNTKVTAKLDHQHDILYQIRDHTSQIVNSLTPQVQRQTAFSVTVHAGSPTTPLHEAAKADDALKVRQLLRSTNVDVNHRDEHGCTPLHLARNTECAKRLLAHPNISKDMEDDGGRSPLHCAVLKRRLNVVKALLEAGVDTTLTDDHGNTAAFYARDCFAAFWMLQHGFEVETRDVRNDNDTGLIRMAWLNDEEGVRFFLDQGANVNAQNESNDTALTNAARHGVLQVAVLLLADGARTELADDAGYTPLLLAVEYKRYDVVEFMLRHNANPEAMLQGGNTALLEACVRDHLEIAMLLVDCGANVHAAGPSGQTPLLHATGHGQFSLVNLLLGRGADVECKDAKGNSALSLSATAGHTAVLRELIRAGVQLDVLFKDGCTALDTAARLGHHDFVGLLLESGVDVDTYGDHDKGVTALAQACEHGHIDVVKQLLKHGARHDIGERASGLPAISIAATYGRDEIVRLLLQHGASVTQRGFEGISHTPLMFAARTGRHTTIEILVDGGAEVDAQTTNAWTAMHITASNRHANCVEVLIQKGANASQQTDNGATALMIAAENGDLKTAQILVDSNAGLTLRDTFGRTALHHASRRGGNEKMEQLLIPIKDQQDRIRSLQKDSHASEVAAHLNRIYR